MRMSSTNQSIDMTEKDHAIYVVRFSDGRIKFGSTSNVKKRMTYYRQEARRNCHDSLVWYSPKPFSCKEDALHAERALRLYFRNETQKNQREWLIRTVELPNVIQAADEIRHLIGKETDAEKAEFPWMGSTGGFRGLAA